MTSVRDIFERNIEGLNDIYLKYENDIKNYLQQLIDEEKFEEALILVDEKIKVAILDFEKRKENVKKILQTKLSLSFDESEKGILTEWDNAIINAISKIEMLWNTFIQKINKKITERVRIPAIEKFLIEVSKKKAFTRMTFDFVAKRLNVPKQKVEEVVEDLIFTGKLIATIDQVTDTIIFAEVAAGEATTRNITPPKSSVPPPTKFHPISPLSPKEEIPQPIPLNTPISEHPIPIDLSSEPPDISMEMSETPPNDLEIPPEIDFAEAETIDISPGVKTVPLIPKETPIQQTSIKEIPEIVEDTKISTPTVLEENKENQTIISFFKKSLDELSEKDMEKAKKKQIKK
ncbi:MAG: PCI domain-containing protein [Promethearchaeota archaeon]